MSPLFDTITTYHATPNSTGSLITAVDGIVGSAEFPNRLGKRVYLNWLQRCSSEGTLCNLISDNTLRSVKWFSSPSKRVNVVELCRDSLNRDLNVLFTATVMAAIMTDYISASNTGDEDRVLLTPVLATIHSWIVRVKKREGNVTDMKWVISRLFFRLTMLVPSFATIDIRVVLVALLDMSPEPTVMVSLIESCIGTDVLWLLRAVLYVKSGPTMSLVPCGTLMATTVQFIQDSLSRSASDKIIKGRSTRFRLDTADLFLVAKLGLVQDGLDFSITVRLVKEIETANLSSFELMVVQYAFIGPLLLVPDLNDPRTTNEPHPEISKCVAVIVTGLTRLDTRTFFIELLEYMVLQLRELPVPIRERVKATFTDRIPQTLFDCINSIKVVASFFDFPEVTEEVEPVVDPIVEEPVPTSHVEFDKLLDLLRKRK